MTPPSTTKAARLQRAVCMPSAKLGPPPDSPEPILAPPLRLSGNRPPFSAPVSRMPSASVRLACDAATRGLGSKGKRMGEEGGVRRLGAWALGGGRRSGGGDMREAVGGWDGWTQGVGRQVSPNRTWQSATKSMRSEPASPWFVFHASMTEASLTQTTNTLSIPASSRRPSISAFLSPGTWHVDQVGVKAPGSVTTRNLLRPSVSWPIVYGLLGRDSSTSFSAGGSLNRGGSKARVKQGARSYAAAITSSTYAERQHP